MVRSAAAPLTGMSESGHPNRVHHIIPDNRVHHVHAIRDLTEHRVHAVQVARIGLAQHNEELAPTGVLPGMGHRECTWLVFVWIAFGLARDRPSGTAGAHATITVRQIARQRIPTLHDEVRDHAVELHPIIELLDRKSTRLNSSHQ